VTDLHVDDFCKDAGRALAALYEAFPRPQTLFVEDLIGPDQVDEFGMHSPRHLACFSTLLWLGEEGYFRYVDVIRQQAVDQAVLTAQAFTMLSLPAPGFEPPGATELPESLRIEQQTHLSRLRLALSARSSSDIRGAVMDLMTAMLAYART